MPSSHEAESAASLSAESLLPNPLLEEVQKAASVFPEKS